MSDDPIRGSCLCGAVRYEVRGEAISTFHCHCEICRKQHGAAFATYIELPPGALRVTAGESVQKILPHRFVAAPIAEWKEQRPQETAIEETDSSGVERINRAARAVRGEKAQRKRSAYVPRICD